MNDDTLRYTLNDHERRLKVLESGAALAAEVEQPRPFKVGQKVELLAYEGNIDPQYVGETRVIDAGANFNEIYINLTESPLCWPLAALRHVEDAPEAELRTCDICGLPLAGSMIGNGDGTGQRFAHPECWYRKEADRWQAEAKRLEGERDIFKEDAERYNTVISLLNMNGFPQARKGWVEDHVRAAFKERDALKAQLAAAQVDLDKFKRVARFNQQEAEKQYARAEAAQARIEAGVRVWIDKICYSGPTPVWHEGPHGGCPSHSALLIDIAPIESARVPAQEAEPGEERKGLSHSRFANGRNECLRPCGRVCHEWDIDRRTTPGTRADRDVTADAVAAWKNPFTTCADRKEVICPTRPTTHEEYKQQSTRGDWQEQWDGTERRKNQLAMPRPSRRARYERAGLPHTNYNTRLRARRSGEEDRRMNRYTGTTRGWNSPRTGTRNYNPHPKTEDVQAARSNTRRHNPDRRKA